MHHLSMPPVEDGQATHVIHVNLYKRIFNVHVHEVIHVHEFTVTYCTLHNNELSAGDMVATNYVHVHICTCVVTQCGSSPDGEELPVDP